MGDRVLFLVVISVLAIGSTRGYAQDTDSLKITINEADTVYIDSYYDRFNPRKALLYSAILPGMGQIYNKKYWKLPLVYGGIAAVGYALNFYQSGYKQYRAELFYLLENDPTGVSPEGFNEEQLRTIVNRVRRERDFYLIVAAGVYALQVIDAHVDAHLKAFDLNPELQVKMRPYTDQSVLAGPQLGLALYVEF